MAFWFSLLKEGAGINVELFKMKSELFIIPIFSSMWRKGRLYYNR